MTLNTGYIINNRYRIVKLLGQGGFGAVYKAWDLNLNRACALKENLDTSPEAERQFVREARVLANLAHPNLPHVIDHFLVAGQGQYLVMELIEGEDLESLVQRQGPLTPQQALPWIGQIADAVQYLHSQHPPVIHRDIKPANIRITSAGRAVLVNFGLVKIYDSHVQTTSGARAFTQGYSPPEQYGTGSTDARTDIYALAATLYALLTGQQPQESVQRVGADRVVAANQINRQVTATVGQAIQRAMALTPSQRYQTVADFKAALQLMPMALPVPRPSVPAPIGSNWIRNLIVFALSVGLLIVCGWGLVQMLPSLANATTNATATTPTRAVAIPTPSATTTRMPATATATTRATATATPTANVTATVIPSPTVDAWATTQSRAAFVVIVQSGLKGIVTMPNGTLPHNSANVISVYTVPDTVSAPVSDMVIQATFYNPYAATSTNNWDYGFMFRSEGVLSQFRLIVQSNSTWQLYNHTGSASGILIDSGSITTYFNVSSTGSNVIKLIAKGNTGLLYVNGVAVADLDLLARSNAGTVSVATGVFENDQKSGETTHYENFTVQSIFDAPATVQAEARTTRVAFVATVEFSRNPIFGPSNGTLTHNGSIAVYTAHDPVSDLVIEAKFYKPYAASTAIAWDYGFMFRDKGGNDQFRLGVKSDRRWWLSDGANFTPIVSGTIARLDVNDNGSNIIKVIAKGNTGLLYVNGDWVANLDLSARSNAGTVSVATGMFEGDQKSGKETRYENFTVQSIIDAQATAQANAAAQARAAFVATVQARKKIVFGPYSALLTHATTGYVSYTVSAINESDMVIKATFYNPYAASTAIVWDCGFLFRDDGHNNRFLLVVKSDTEWQLWNTATFIDKGNIANLKVSATDSNVIELIAKGSKGQLYVNDSWVADLDLSARSNAGTVSVATGLLPGNEVSGKETRYKDFTVWSIP